MSEVTPTKSPEAFGEATRTGLAAINNIALVSCTGVSLALSVYGDLSGGRSAGLAAVAGWVLCVCLAVYLAGRSSGASGVARSLGVGFSMVRSDLRFSALVLLLSAGAAFSVWSRAKADTGGVLASLIPMLARVQDDTSAIRAVVTREVSPIEQLSRLGYSTSPADVCRAYDEGNSEVLTLMASAGLRKAAVAVPLGDGFVGLCLERALSRRGEGEINLAELLKRLPLAGADVERLYLSREIGAHSPAPLALQALQRAAGLTVDPKARLAWVQASPLMFAVWGSQSAAVRELLAMGAPANLGARVEILGSIRSHPFQMPEAYALEVTPLAEARRLGSSDLVDALSAAGGVAAIRKLPSALDPAGRAASTAHK